MARRIHFAASTIAHQPVRGSLERLKVEDLSRRLKDLPKHSNILSKHGWFDGALESAEFLQQQGITVSRDIVYNLVIECAKWQDIESGRRLYVLMVHSGLESIAALADHLIRLFASCGCLVEACKVFNRVLNPSRCTWNGVIRAHAKLDHGKMASQLHDIMLLSGTNSEDYTYVASLQACISNSSINKGRHVHGQLIRSGIQWSTDLGTILVHMYCKLGSLQEARTVFDHFSSQDTSIWNAMISGYVKQGQLEQARYLFNTSISRDAVSWATMITGYAKFGNLQEAHKLFNESPNKDAVSWGALIGGYAEHGEGHLALEYLHKMQLQSISPDKVIFLSALKACASIGVIDQGRRIHRQMLEAGIVLDVDLKNALVYMYAMCGYPEEAYQVWGRFSNQDVVSWNAIIAGHAQSGNVKLVGQCLDDMQQEGIKPNRVTFSSVLAACSHAGLVDEGCRYLKFMSEDHGIIPDAYHFNCIIDLLGGSGYLEEAGKLLLIIQPDVTGWTSLLVACRTYQNVELARRCFDQLVKIDNNLATAYVLMSGIYSDAQLWKEAARVEELRKQARAWKKPAKAWIEVDDKVHEFIVGDKSHPQIDAIDAVLKRLSNRMKEEGYRPKVNLVLQQMSEEEKQVALCGHAEKLAIAFGLATTPPGTTLRARKNLRMCMDCHDATKIISRIEGREIIVHDACHVHCFKDGSCSCGDYY